MKIPVQIRSEREFDDTKKLNRLSDFHIYCIHSFFASLCVEGNLIAFADSVYKTTYVYKNFLSWGIVNDEAKSLGFVEEFYCSGIHLENLICWCGYFADSKLTVLKVKNWFSVIFLPKNGKKN